MAQVQIVSAVGVLAGGFGFTQTYGTTAGTQGFGNGVSESFVNTVPAPGALAILGLGGYLLIRRGR